MNLPGKIQTQPAGQTGRTGGQFTREPPLASTPLVVNGWIRSGGSAPKLVAQALEKIAALGNVVLGEREAVLAAVARVEQGWGFADALHHALSEGCVDFVTLDAGLAKRAKAAGKLAPLVTKL